ncbi:hypothetical protein EES43_20815 [Streptomyces sp. ADI96-02]|uniref:hypothetical protein n=1 Tax=Streptomyces sp. ADI96-02 TaxID=1522760 RepID=UPI000F90C9C5|nr:hypothetical protein [Streptomyces sp. ADI96-02]RPK57792.1 hypothetical protein EES43_20815 [Streptomyces sp. ADI96-02]
MHMNPSPGRRRPRGSWSRLLTTTALATALTVVVTGNPLPPPPAERIELAAVPETSGYDLDAAAETRAEQCLLNLMLRKGGQELKAVSRAGLSGTDEDLHRAAESEYWYDGKTPLAVAFAKDKAWTDAKGDELWGRDAVWEKSLAIPAQTTPPGYTVTGFEWVESDDNPFNTTGLLSWLDGEYWKSEYDLYHEDQTPLASQESVNAVNAIAAQRYSEDRHEDYEDLSALDDMTFMHPMYADDARIFLQHGGFPTSAPAPDSMEFRVDVEALKSRFASCATENPPDPHKVLTDEVVVASTEWQAELAGQKAQREAIMAAEAKASRHLTVATQALGEALGQSIIAARLTDWQAYWLKQSPSSTMFYPTAAEFAKVKADIETARARAQGRVFVASRASLAAQDEAVRAESAKQAAYTVADTAGLPRGRGLMYGQQGVQVAKASAAAALAVSKAAETAANATRASAADSKTLMALAETQAHASKAEFRRKAAEEAEAQAKAAAEGAALQAKLAAENATRAKAAQAKAEAAEAAAKTAAADAKAKRATAEAERDTAAAERRRADAERAKADAAEKRAVQERASAATALSAAKTAGETADARSDDAVQASVRALEARDAALAAEQNKQAKEARARALESAAAAAEGTSAATETRQAATEARSAADAAAGHASAARSAANDATTASIAARAAATRSEGAAARSQAAADGAAAAAARTGAAVKKAHAAAAEAIDASEAAAQNVVRAEALAKEAAAKAVKARQDAAAAKSEAILAQAASIRTAGFAYATAQAAVAARDSAAQVIQPANDAIELGSPYQDTDSSAGLAVLTGQASKTLAEQQAALAKAKADQAKKAAVEAAALAAKASADAKAAAEAAARAADWAAKAAASLEQARASAAEAAKAADAARRAEANTVEYDRQANEDALAAKVAAGQAAEEASAASASATEAEKDAAGARSAASAAEADADTADSVATAAEQDAVVAEGAAADAVNYATEADRAADRAEEEQRLRDAEAREKRVEAGSVDTGPELGADDEALLMAACGQVCVDEFRAAKALAGQDVLDWVVANGGQVLIDLVGWNDAKECFTKGDVEGCLWTLVNAVSFVALVGKIPAVTSAVIKIGGGIAKFLDKSVTAKHTLDRLRKVIEQTKKAGSGASCLLGLAGDLAGFATGRASGPSLRAVAEKPSVCMRSAIGDDSALISAAQEATKNQKLQVDFDNMFAQLKQGNMPGGEYKSLTGTGIIYFRSRKGARLFVKKAEDGWLVVAKADKGNEDKVIKRLRKIYG